LEYDEKTGTCNVKMTVTIVEEEKTASLYSSENHTILAQYQKMNLLNLLKRKKSMSITNAR